MQEREKEWTFPAVRGIQAGREYYVTMLPLRLLERLFRAGTDQEGDPRQRSQRLLTRSRVPEIARYVTGNPDSYAFAALTATVDGAIRFDPAGGTALGRRLGVLAVPLSARFSLDDGQHRAAGIARALADAGPDSPLQYESIGVTLFGAAERTRSQQRFADLNRYGVRPSPSISALYDHRSETAAVTGRVVGRVPVLRDLTELERSSLPRRSPALFTLSAVDRANRALLHGLGGLPEGQRAGLAEGFWAAAAAQFPEWEQARLRETDAAVVRRDFIHASALALHALGRAGNAIARAAPAAGADSWQRALAPLSGVDWRRANAGLWEGRATSGGRLATSHAHVLLTAAAIRRVLGLPLPPDERQLDEDFTARTSSLEP